MVPLGFIAFLTWLDHAGADRAFNGLYTIVNAATGRKLVADTKGFYTARTDAIPKTQLWRIIPDENATYLLQNDALEARIYAQVGQDREKGFFVIGSESPVYRDQRWHLQWTSEFGEGYSGSGYSIQNLKSKRNILDGSAGLMATEGIAAGSFWWLISQERDELGLELAKRQTQCQEQQDLQGNSISGSQDRLLKDVPVFNKEIFTRSITWPIWELLALGPLSIAILAVLCRHGKTEFKFQIYKQDRVDQVIRVECPGVRHEDIEVKLIPNGCDVLLHRRALPGLEEVWWKHRFHLSISEGFFEFVEEQMQLEHGFLTLVLRKVQEDRTIRFAHSQHFQHFKMDAFDDELTFDYPAATSPRKLDDSLETWSCGSNQSTSLS